MRDPKEPTKQKKDNTKAEGYDDPSKKTDDGGFNAVCISSLVFAFVGIGVLLSLATWSYVTTMRNDAAEKSAAAAATTVHKSDTHLKLRPLKNNTPPAAPPATPSPTTAKHSDVADSVEKIHDIVHLRTDDVVKTGSLLPSSSASVGNKTISAAERRQNVSFPLVEASEDLNLDEIEGVGEVRAGMGEVGKGNEHETGEGKRQEIGVETEEGTKRGHEEGDKREHGGMGDNGGGGSFNSVGSLGRRIESFSPSEVYLMKERLKNHRHTFNSLLEKKKKKTLDENHMGVEKDVDIVVDSF